jgi:chitinase
VSVSIGGYGGTKLGQTCSSPAATAAAYQQVVTKYALRAIDFDLEEPEYENATAIHNELGAAQILQRNNPGLYVSVTTAGTASGTGWFGQQMLNDARGLGFTPANFSIMPFDGGFSGAASQVSALEAFHGILMNTFGWDSATAYAHEGVSMMNGRSDAAEYFQLADFQTVLDYATSHHLARYTFWSVNRDRQCANPNRADHVRHLQQRAAGRLGLHQVHRPVRRRHPAHEPADRPADDHRAAVRLVHRAGLERHQRVHRRAARQLQRPHLAGPVVDPERDPRHHSGLGRPGQLRPDVPARARQCPAAWVSGTAYVGGSVVGYAGHRWTAKWWDPGRRPGRQRPGRLDRQRPLLAEPRAASLTAIQWSVMPRVR